MTATSATPRLDSCGDFLTVEEAGQILRIGRNTAYERVADGTLPSVRLGRRIVIPKSALVAFAGQSGGDDR